MKRHGRALHFAVTGALLGGIGVGCAKPRGPYTNTGMMGEPEEQLHVNPGPDEDPGAADGGGAEPTEPEPPEHVNEGPVEEPPAEPPKLDEGTNNVRKVEDEGPPATPEPRYVNTVKVPDQPK